MEKEIVSEYNGFITKKGNYIWAGALTLAWNEFIDEFIKEPIKFKPYEHIEGKNETENPESFLTSLWHKIVGNSKKAPEIEDPDKIKKIVDNFNNKKFSTNDINKNSVYVKSGYGQETIKEINAELKRRFPQRTFGSLNYKLTDIDLIIYAYLTKEINFQTPFTKSTSKRLLFNGKKVRSFFADNWEQRHQIKYAYYKNEDQFVINIMVRNKHESIYFIKDYEIQTLDQAIEAIQFYEDKMDFSLEGIDEFEMPYVEVDVQHELCELEGCRIANENLNGYVLKNVYEAIKLNIDETGAKVENEAANLIIGAELNPPQPKLFILNKEFWIIMKEYHKHPYLCALIKDPIDN